MKKILFYINILSLAIILSCKEDNNTNHSGPISPGNDQNFTIVAHSDTGFTSTNRKVMVFGIPVYAFYDVEDSKLLHAANIMAQYLDNDENGIVDNSLLLTTLLFNEAALFIVNLNLK